MRMLELLNLERIRIRRYHLLMRQEVLILMKNQSSA